MTGATQVPSFIQDVADKLTLYIASSVDKLVLEMLCEVFEIPTTLPVDEIVTKVNEIGGISYASEFRAMDGILVVDLFRDAKKIGQRAIQVEVKL
jgi:hypothetical protein